MATMNTRMRQVISKTLFQLTGEYTEQMALQLIC
jgi:hypothetical protein